MRHQKPRRRPRQARLLIEQAEALGETPEDPLLLFSALYGFWAVNALAFNGDMLRELAAEFMVLAEKQGATVPLLIAHRVMGISLLYAGDFAKAGSTSNRRLRYTIPRASSAGDAIRPRCCVAGLIYRSFALWSLGHPKAAKVDIDNAIDNAREIGQAATLMTALSNPQVSPTSIAETMRQQTRNSENLSLWRKKNAPRTGKRAEWCRKVAFLH